ncbi:MAG: hypothetical protein O2885_12170 [Proteobacteria bacterium]|nr:hypothetical protein [Pseudomonadota bacterium]MDA0857644.1 hypothetical protein [Pseudomonadota bacterium]
MHTTVTLNQARLKLHIGKDRLRKLMEDCGIEPRVTGRQRKVINAAQLEHLRRIVEEQQPVTIYQEESSKGPSGPVGTGLETSRTSSEPVEVRLTGEGQDHVRVAVLEAQAELLRDQLGKTEKQLEKTELVLKEEKEDRRRKDAEVAEQTTNFQKMIQFLQQDNQHLRQQLLEAPRSSRFDVDAESADVEDSVDLRSSKSPQQPIPPPAEPTSYAPAKGGSWGLGIGLGAVAAAIIFYALISDQGAKFFPNIQQKLVGALHLTEANSIVPYSFDQQGNLQ